MLGGVVVEEVAPAGFRGPADDGLGEDLLISEVRAVYKLKGLGFVLDGGYTVLSVAVADGGVRVAAAAEAEQRTR